MSVRSCRLLLLLVACGIVIGIVVTTRTKTGIDAASRSRTDSSQSLDALVSAWRRELQVRPDDAALRRSIAEIMAGCGLRWEAVQEFSALDNEQDHTTDQLICLARNGDSVIDADDLKRRLQQFPDDSLARCGLVSLAIRRRDFVKAHQLLRDSGARTRSVVAPKRSAQDGTEFFRKTRMRLRVLVSLLTESRLSDSERQFLITESAQRPVHPVSWKLIHMQLAQRGDAELSLRCLVQALKRDPWNPEFVHATARALRQAEQPGWDRLMHVDHLLRNIEEQAAQVSRESADTKAMQRIVAGLTELQRHREAVRWARVALRTSTELDWARETVLQRSRVENTPNEPLVLSCIPGELLIPPDAAELREELAGGIDVAGSRGMLKFDDVAESANLVFTYDAGVRDDQEGMRMHQWTGGGAGVIDIDNDTWPDVYLSQGGQLLGVEPATDGSHDVVFRNLRGQSYAAVPSTLTPRARGFGQGVAVGDLNGDGFDDVCVANIGANQLFMNQGDGTFRPATLPDDDSWTTSLAMVDLNADQNPDIYDVNYVAGENAFELTCDHDGRQRVCGPRDFPAAPDRILLSDGEGRFHTQSDDELHQLTADSRGMGLVAGRFTTNASQQVYVAADESPNMLLDFSGSAPVDVATAMGTAVDQYGASLGSMGIACGDPDNNGHADLFVTNYHSEANTLYTQSADGLYSTNTAAAGLRSPGFLMLGFGCQFADFDADGDEDLVVANGHLDDFTHLGQACEMRPQLFENDGTGRFLEPSVSSAWFSEPQLARAMALLDWNGDQRMDFIVTRLNAPVSLVENQSEQHAPSVFVRLVATSSARHPVGARLQLTSANTQQTRWITAGDGYQCSNTSAVQLAMPLGDDQHLTITWPDRSTEIVPLPDESDLVLVLQGRQRLYNLPR